MFRIRHFFSQRTTALSLFPVAHLLLVFLTVLGIIQVYTDFPVSQDITRLIFAGIFAFFLSLIPGVIKRIRSKSNISTTSISEDETNIQHHTLSPHNSTHNYNTLSAIIQFIAILFGAVFFFLLPKSIDTISYGQQVWIIGTILLTVALIFLVIAREKSKNELFTWSWWIEIFESILIGGVAGLILRGGISACIKSLDYLFSLHFSSDKIYGYIGVVSLVFVAGSIALINFSNKTNETPTYTRIHRIFGQYIFLPLTIIYGLILIAYGVKILMTGIRPNGTIIYMVLGYISFGLLTWLTTYPALPNKNISRYHFILFASFLLTSLLMIPAIQQRIQQYGLTIDRYFVCAIIIWIVLFSIGGMIFKNHRMLIIITLLVLLGGFALYGGNRNATNLSMGNQKNRLLQEIQKSNLALPLGSGALTNTTGEARGIIINSLKYILKNNGEKGLENIIAQNQLGEITKNKYPYEKEQLLCKNLGIQECYYNFDRIDEQHFSFYSKNRLINLSVDGYSMIHSFSCQGGKTVVKLGNTQFDFAPYMDKIYTYAEEQQHPYGDKTTAEIDQMSPAEYLQYDSGYAITTDTAKIILYGMGGRQLQNKDNITYYDIDYCDGIALVK